MAVRADFASLGERRPLAATSLDPKHRGNGGLIAALAEAAPPSDDTFWVVRKVVRKVVTLEDHLQLPKPPPALMIRSVPESDYPPPTS
jgi:hypothetical protein